MIKLDKCAGFAMLSLLVVIVLLTGVITFIVYGDPSSSKKQLNSIEKGAIARSIISQAETLIGILSMCSIGDKRRPSSSVSGALNPSASGEASLYPNTTLGTSFTAGIPIEINTDNDLACASDTDQIDLNLSVAGSPVATEINTRDRFFNKSNVDNSGDYLIKIPGFKNWSYLPEATKASIILETEGSVPETDIRVKALQNAANHFGSLAVLSGTPVSKITITVIQN